MAVITVRRTLSTDVIANENKSKPGSLSLLSSIAAMMPIDRRGDMDNHEHERLSPVPITTVDAMKGPEHLKRSGKISRSLSRSFSSRNLVQTAINTSLSPKTGKKRKYDQSEESFFAQGTRLRSISLGSCRSASAQTSLSETSNSEDSSGRLSEMDSEESNSTSSSTSTTTTTTLRTLDAATSNERVSSIDATIHSPADEIMKNVYQSHEMQLPESCSIGKIMMDDSFRKSKKVVDDYNYDVVSSTPLHIPPRLPNAGESFAIAEKSREEKNNWGWYA